MAWSSSGFVHQGRWLAVAGLKAGDSFFTGLLGKAKARVAAEQGIKAANAFGWPVGGDKVGVLLDIVGINDAAPAPFGLAKTARPPLPAEVTRGAAEYLKAFRSVDRDRMLAVERDLVLIARTNLKAILTVLRESANAKEVADAAILLGYLDSPAQLKEVMPALIGRFDDPSDSVRNAALRSAGLLEERHGKSAGPLVDVKTAHRAFSRPWVLDRQKAGMLLTHLARHASLRPAIRELAVDRARAIARTKLFMHRRGGLVLLREILGPKRMSDADWLGWLEEHSPQDLAWWNSMTKARAASEGR